jgi:hypothetical protein
MSCYFAASYRKKNGAPEAIAPRVDTNAQTRECQWLFFRLCCLASVATRYVAQSSCLIFYSVFRGDTMKSFFRTLILSAAMTAALPALAAAEVKGAKFADTYQVANQALQFNGAGVRVKIIVDVYAAGLYLPKKDKTAMGAINQAGPKSIQIVLLRELTGEDFAEAMIKGFKKNNSDAELAKFQPKLDEIKTLMVSFGSVKKGTTIHMNLVPGMGTRVLVDGATKGKDIAGDDFYNALLKIWLGNNPVDADLKEALLSGN